MMSDIEAYLSKNNDGKSAKEGKNLYESGHVTVWVCLSTGNGDTLTGECGCLAGYGESCKHVSALLHYIEYEVRVGNNTTCTCIPQQWGRKTRNKQKKIHQPDKTKNLKI